MFAARKLWFLIVIINFHYIICSAQSPFSFFIVTPRWNPSCYSCFDGSIIVHPQFGTPPHQVAINSGSWIQLPLMGYPFNGLGVGTYVISARDANNVYDYDTIQLTFQNTIPVVSSINLSHGRYFAAGTNIGLTATVSNNPTNYYWVIEGGNPSTMIGSYQPSFSTQIINPGFYDVILRVSNSSGYTDAYSSFTAYPSNTFRAPPDKKFVIQQQYPSHKEADPVNLATGSYEYKHTDLQISALGKDLNFTRYYNTVNALDDGSLGYGWSHSFDTYISNQKDTNWVVHYADGHSSHFVPIVGGNGASIGLFGGINEKLFRNPSTKKFKLTFKSGEVYNFDSAGRLIDIIDLNGNITLLSYTNGNLTSITAPGGRKLNLGYTGSKIATVTDQLSRSILYSYDIQGNLTSVKNTDNGITGFVYDAGHRITVIKNPSGDTLLSNTYDSTGKVISQKDAYQNITTFAYHLPTTNDVTITYPGNFTSVAHHDSFYRLTMFKDELGHIKTTAYDYNHNPVLSKNENGAQTQIIFDSLGNPLSIKKPGNTLSGITYNTLSKPLRIVNPSGDTATYSYDSSGNITNALLPGNVSTQYTYNSKGHVISAKDALNKTTTFTYNSFGDVASIVSPSGTKVFGYDTVGRIVSSTNENGHKTTFGYNSRDQLISVIDPLGHISRDSFDLNGNKIARTDKNGNTTRFFYDKKDRLIKIQRANGGITTITYDARDNKTSIVDANGNSKTFAYDAKNRVISETNVLGTTLFTYDAKGNRISLQDGTNNTSTFNYDSLDRLIQAKDALSNITTLAYDAVGQNTSIKDPLNRITSFQYNKPGFLIHTTDAANHGTSATYDALGNILSVTDPNGHKQNLGYNAVSRLQSHKDAENNLDSFVYDAIGNLLKTIKPTGNISRAYDSANRLKTVVNSTGDTYNYTYDPNGNILTAQNNSGTIFFTYNTLNKVSRYVDVFGDTLKFSYDSAGNRKTITYPGNKIITYGYNRANLLSNVTDWNGNVSRYVYDAAGRVIARINPFGDTCRYTYDAAGRKISQTNKIGDSIIHKSIFTLNAAGEKTSEQITGIRPRHLKQEAYNYTYEDNDALTSDSINTYTNDGAGNRLTGGNTYTFTVDNLLKSTNTATYKYDAFGNRIAKSASGTYRRHLLNLTDELSQVVQERDTNGVLIASYIYGLGLLARIDSSGDIQYYHFDGQHNTIALSNDSGKLTDTYTFEPFGKQISHSGTTEQPFTFLGEYGVQQETSSFYYVRARYYDAQNHRFLSEDAYQATITNPQTINRYVYGLNNPMSIFDPSGLYGNKDNSGLNNPMSIFNPSGLHENRDFERWERANGMATAVNLISSSIQNLNTWTVAMTLNKKMGLVSLNDFVQLDKGFSKWHIGNLGFGYASAAIQFSKEIHDIDSELSKDNPNLYIVAKNSTDIIFIGIGTFGGHWGYAASTLYFIVDGVTDGFGLDNRTQKNK